MPQKHSSELAGPPSYDSRVIMSHFWPLIAGAVCNEHLIVAAVCLVIENTLIIEFRHATQFERFRYRGLTPNAGSESTPSDPTGGLRSALHRYV